MQGIITKEITNCEGVAAIEVAAIAECSVCFGLHDEEIHDATVSIRGWLRQEIARRTEPPRFAYGATVEAVAASIVEPMLFQ